MKVLFFNPYADQDVKGAARRIEFLRRLLDLRGIQNSAILGTDYMGAEKSAIERLALSLHLKRLAYFLYAWRQCTVEGQTVISEVIFTPTWHRNMVLTVHDLKAFDSEATRGGQFRRWAYLVFARLAKRIMVVSNAVRDDVERYCGVRRDRIFVVPNGISRERLQLASSLAGQTHRFDFIYVSSFAKHKRHALLLRAAPPGSRLCLIGRDLGALAEVQHEAHRRREEMSVDILENVNTDDELFSLLGQSRCGVFPSVFEGFGIPLLEYSAVGLHIIASDIPPFRELAEYVDTFVPPDDEQALRAALVAALAKTQSPFRNTDKKVERGDYTEGAVSERLERVLCIKS